MLRMYYKPLPVVFAGQADVTFRLDADASLFI